MNSMLPHLLFQLFLLYFIVLIYCVYEFSCSQNKHNNIILDYFEQSGLNLLNASVLKFKPFRFSVACR